MEPMLAETILFGGNFAPRNYAFCAGQIMVISSNTALFSILGTTYGGDGRTSFALPDLQGRVAMQPGNGPGLTPLQPGERGGWETNTLGVDQLPTHNHSATATVKASAEPTTNNPQEAYIAPVSTTYRGNDTETAAFGGSGVNHMASDSVEVTTGMTGGHRPVNNMQPYLGVNHIMALYGVYPSRN
ncbi:MAG: phage tail protein [Alteromonadaceae bacterium]|nr:phage tail protein [Alteromonadaceae bacterium]